MEDQIVKLGELRCDGFQVGVREENGAQRWLYATVRLSQCGRFKEVVLEKRVLVRVLPVTASSRSVLMHARHNIMKKKTSKKA